VKVLQRLRDAIRRERRDKWQGQWFKHHDNPPSHTLLVEQQFLTEKNVSVITQSTWPPDLAPTDFFLSSTQKMGLKGICFATMEDIKSNARAKHREITEEAFRLNFQQWQVRWSKCARARKGS
jgi:hypothetical protein